MVLKKYFLSFIFCFFFGALSFARETTDSLRIDNSSPEKRTFPEGFGQQYSGPEYQYDTTNATGWFTLLKEAIIQFFIDLFKLSSRHQAENIADIFLKVFYILIFIAVVYFIVRAIMNREGQWIFRKPSDRKIIAARDIENNIHATDFHQLVSDAVSGQHYREAVRYYYLWLLKELSGRELIDYDAEKTNSDYLRELENHRLQKDFRYASYLYNYIWYGEFDIDRTQYDNAARAFSALINSVNQ